MRHAVQPLIAALYLPEQGDCIRRRCQFARRTVEQRQRHLGLQIANQPADRGLGDAHQGARGGHAGGLKHRTEGVDLTVVDAHVSP
jgi:hypothetical protein